MGAGYRGTPSSCSGRLTFPRCQSGGVKTSGLFIGGEALAFNSATECGVLLPNQALEKNRSLFSCVVQKFIGEDL
jgi:hypothetical protein